MNSDSVSKTGASARGDGQDDEHVHLYEQIWLANGYTTHDANAAGGGSNSP